MDRETYSDLFAIIGVRYGSTSVTTFKLPDMRGRFPRGWDHGSGRDPDASGRSNRGDGTGGDVVGSTQNDEFKAHTHTYLNPTLTGGGSGPTNNQYPENSPTGSTGGSETRPKNINMVYAIRALSI